ncbi:inorganic pyrophosphatase, mitochondrial [Pelomyxa schiedti]|nr:inorganic pyrophosphatase, mitochondrial [Pelomyxa schiedti]
MLGTHSLFKAHPWHGVPIGTKAPQVVTAFIEMVPSDSVKYEVDKVTGYLKVDRPQKYSNVVPSLYGFIPQTYCGERVAEKAGVKEADGDPLDICVLSERPIVHGDILVQAVPLGGIRLIDRGQADDKIIAYLQQDEFYQGWRTLSDMPTSMVKRLEHYFLTYKSPPGEASLCEIRAIYGREDALDVITRSMLDYNTYTTVHHDLRLTNTIPVTTTPSTPSSSTTTQQSGH